MDSVKPYSSEGSKKKQVKQMFDNIAGSYDFLNRLLSMRIDVLWRKRLMKEVKQTQPQKILDLATGTADVAIQLATEIPEAQIVGLDISPKMLEVGQKKVTAKALDNRVQLVEGDAENLPYPDNTFDVVTVAFGVRNYENLQAGLKESKRVLKQGGKLVVLEFSKPRTFPFKQLFQFYFKNILPFIGRVTSKDVSAYTYLYNSVQVFPDGKAFVQELDLTGFKQNQCKPLTFGISSLYTGSKL